jgi:tetratricopeptide (TPR) repeat protein
LSQAVTSLRRDDPASLAEARAKLQGVVHAWPGYLEARATHLVAMLFQLDDARMELQRLTDETTAINTQINELTEQQSQPDSQDSRDQVNALVDRLGELKAQIDPAAERTAVLDGEVNDAFQALQQAAAVGPSPQDEIHLIRAQALYFGVKGSEQALALSERYRAKGGQEGWGDLAWAEYALNARSAPDTLRQAREALEVLRASDPSWVRLYLLIGRLALAEEALDAATTAFDSAITLNPKHQTAQTLLRLAEGHKKQATADEFAP